MDSEASNALFGANSRMLMSPCSSIVTDINGSNKNRADTFPIAEIELMLKEMKNRSEVILSLSPSSHRLKKSAWEEVTAIMGIYFPKRSPEQVKKKWENLLTKTRRKVRQGVINTSSWSKLNDLVWKFLLENRETKYLFGPGRFSRADELSNLFGYNFMSSPSLSSSANTNNGSHSLPSESWTASLQTIEHSMPLLNSQQNLSHQQHQHATSSINTCTNSTLLGSINNICHDKKGKNNAIVLNSGVEMPNKTNSDSQMFPHISHFNDVSKPVQNELLEMWRKEHDMRMKILDLQHQAALIQHELLKKQLTDEHNNQGEHIQTNGNNNRNTPNNSSSNSFSEIMTNNDMSSTSTIVVNND